MLTVFISYSHSDRRFARTLERRLAAACCRVWRDEKTLLPGDPVSSSVAAALEGADIVVIVISKASGRSHWVRYEIAKATDRMIAGRCRVIPAVKEDVPLPQEVSSLLYADFRKRFANGMSAMLAAVRHDTIVAERQEARARKPVNFVEAAMRQVFEWVGYRVVPSESDYSDYTVDVAGIHLHPGSDRYIPFCWEFYAGFAGETKLGEEWWQSFSNAWWLRNVNESLYMLVTALPLNQLHEVPEGADPDMHWMFAPNAERKAGTWVLIVRVARPELEAELRATLTAAREEIRRKAQVLDIKPITLYQ